MGGEIKIYRITGRMLVSHDRLPTWQKFVQEIRALNEKDALEKVYSLLGSRHKLKRRHIKIIEVKEISPEEASKPYILQILKLERLVK
ncbi:MAG: 50S ribosomal protein L18Ae [Desulfurococcaceae archaeon]